MNPMTNAHQLYLRKQTHHKYFIILSRIFLFVFFIILWEYTTSMNIIDSFIFSSPSKILASFLTLVSDHSIFIHVGVTLYETILSFILVIVVSLIVAISLWFSTTLANVIDPYMVILNSLPKSALAPLLIVWLGANQTTIIICGMSVAIFGSILSLYASFCETDSEKFKLIYTLNGNKLQALTKVVIPSSIPSLISIMKVNIGLCLVGVVIGEFLAARNGLGYLIIYSSQVFKMDWLLMSIVILCMMAMLLYAFINYIESKYNKRYSITKKTSN